MMKKYSKRDKVAIWIMSIFALILLFITSKSLYYKYELESNNRITIAYITHIAKKGKIKHVWYYFNYNGFRYEGYKSTQSYVNENRKTIFIKFYPVEPDLNMLEFDKKLPNCDLNPPSIGWESYPDCDNLNAH